MPDRRPRSKVEVQQLQALPMEAKIIFSQRRIREYYERFEGQVYVAFSGGWDSTGLLYMVRELYPEVPAVFFDTGLEFPEIREFVNQHENVITRRPEMDFRSVITKYGFPIITKRMAQYIRESRSGGPDSKVYRLRMTGITQHGVPSPMGAISKKWQWLVEDRTVTISDKCCHVMKKRPAAVFEKVSGRVPIIGTMAADSSDRLMSWINKGCFYEGKTRTYLTPLMPWTKNDIGEYLLSRGIPYCKIYDMGYARTGCVFCMFGLHLDPLPNRFQLLKRTHPQLWTYCMDVLGLRAVIAHVYKGKVPIE